MKVATGIVVYNPNNMERFRDCIKSILLQVKVVYIFDNGDIGSNYQWPKGVVYLTEHKNMGIAYALNRIMDIAQKEGFEWVVTMDQDSIIPENMVSRYEKAISENDNLGIVCPQVIDTRRSYMEVKKTPKTEFVDFCITSASCTSISAWERVGKFDEWLFIDLVDNDFCKRLILSGYKILKINELVLNQEFGEIIPKNEKSQKFWITVSKLLHNQNFAKLSYKKSVSPMRVYYTCRNVLYVNKKLANYGPVAYKENYNCSSYWGFIISFILPSILRAQDKKTVIKSVFSGIREGRKIKVGKWNADY